LRKDTAKSVIWPCSTMFSKPALSLC